MPLAKREKEYAEAVDVSEPFIALYAEHDLIKRVLDAFFEYCRKIEIKEQGGGEALKPFALFFRSFVEMRHHQHEEKCLLAPLVARGISTERGSIAVLRREHKGAQIYARVLWDLAFLDKEWSRQEYDQVIETGHSYISLMRAHIRKENDIVMPAAKHLLSAKALGEIKAAQHALLTKLMDRNDDVIDTAHKLLDAFTSHVEE